MVEKIDKKILEEAEKILSKETLTSEEVRIILDIKNDLKLEEKMKKMIEFAS